MYVKLDYFTRKCTVVRKVFDNHMRKQTILQLEALIIAFKSDLFFVSRNAALIKKFLEYSGTHAMGYFESRCILASTQ